jgi:Trk K+ transport system NAD-binding subunit
MSRSSQHEDFVGIEEQPRPRTQATSSRPGHIVEASRAIARRWAEANDELTRAEDAVAAAHRQRNAAQAAVDKIHEEAKEVIGLKLGDAFCVAFDDHVVNVMVASKALDSHGTKREVIKVHFERLHRL